MSDVDLKNVTLIVMTCIDIVCFSLAFLYAAYNATKFLIIQRRYNTFYLTPFYLLAITVFGCRVPDLINNLVKWDYREEAFYLTWDYLTTIAVNAKMMLGAFQIGSMVELGISVKLSAYRMSKEDAEKKGMLTRVCVCIAITFLTAGCVLTLCTNEISRGPNTPKWVEVF